jgi:Flp pilus assembly protein TadG
MIGKLTTALLRSASALLSARSGSAAVTFGIALIPLSAAVGAAVDYSRATDVRAKLQSALDAAVLAGVKASTGKTTTASTAFTANFSGSVAQNVSSSFTANADGTLSGTAQASVPTSVLAVLKVSTINVSASAKAKVRNSSSSISNTVCVLLVDTTASQSLLINGGYKVNAPDCEIDVRSTGNQAAVLNGGTTLNVKKICIAGTDVLMNGGTPSVVEKGCAAISDPFAGKLPVVSAGNCTFNNKTYDGSSVTLNPGTYCGWTNFNGSPTITFNPGLYVISGGSMNINSGARITGNGVTFYFADSNSKIQFNGTTTVTLTAPTSGTYADILMFEPSGLAKSPLAFNGTTGSLRGLMYLPSRQVAFNNNSTLSADMIGMVFATLTVNNTEWNFRAGSPGMSRTITTTSGTPVPYLTN